MHQIPPAEAQNASKGTNSLVLTQVCAQLDHTLLLEVAREGILHAQNQHQILPWRNRWSTQELFVFITYPSTGAETCWVTHCCCGVWFSGELVVVEVVAGVQFGRVTLLLRVRWLTLRLAKIGFSALAFPTIRQLPQLFVHISNQTTTTNDHRQFALTQRWPQYRTARPTRSLVVVSTHPAQLQLFLRVIVVLLTL